MACFLREIGQGGNLGKTKGSASCLRDLAILDARLRDELTTRMEIFSSSRRCSGYSNTTSRYSAIPPTPPYKLWRKERRIRAFGAIVVCGLWTLIPRRWRRLWTSEAGLGVTFWGRDIQGKIKGSVGCLGDSDILDSRKMNSPATRPLNQNWKAEYILMVHVPPTPLHLVPGADD